MKKRSKRIKWKTIVSLATVFLFLATVLIACNSSAQLEELEDTEFFSTHVAALSLANDCETYKNYLIETKAKQYAKQRYYFWGYPEDDSDDTASPADPNAGGDEAGEYTTTNLQEAGVDEMGILKNDGSHMYVIENDGVRVIKSWPAAELKELNKIKFEIEPSYEGSYGRGLLLLGDRLIAFRSAYQKSGDIYPGIDVPDGIPFYYRSNSVFYVDVYDVSKPEAPARLQSSRFDGDFNTARSVDGRIYIVMDSQLDTSYFDNLLQDKTFNADLPMPSSDEELWRMSEEERQGYVNRAVPIIVKFLSEETADLKLETLMPVYQQKKNGNAKDLPLLSCQNIYLPKTASQYPGLMSILELSGDDYSQVHSSAIADSAWLVYASRENIYAVSSSYSWFWSCYSDDACTSYSHIHRFNYKGKNGHIQYLNSGEIEGIVQDSFWMSEHKGYLRVATQDQAWNNEKGSSLSVLNLEGPEIKQVGRIDGIAPGERIFASRMFGDKGYLVTFKQTDPLFTLDLSTPDNPKIMGELKINGYSSYIHPLGEDALLTIGKDADDEGRELGVHLQIFDVSDMKKPTRSHQYLIASDGEGSHSSSAALYDHHAFSFHANSGLLAIPMNVYHWNHWMGGHNFSGVVVLKVNSVTGFEELGLIDHAEFKTDPNNWWDELRRTRFMFTDAGIYDKNAFIYTLSSSGIKVSNANKPSEELAKVPF